MNRLLIIIVTLGLFVSCGLVSKYQNGQHSIYSKLLTLEDRRIIGEVGETSKEIELGDPEQNRVLKGRLRIIKTDDNLIFNFVEVGQWIDNGRYGSSGQMHNVEYRDTIVYDNNGNTVSRRVYDRLDGIFMITNEWTSEIIDGSFIQHFKVYNKGILRVEFSKKVLDSSNPKSDLQKKKMLIGTDKGYYPNGKLGYVREYNQEGKLISEEKYGR